MTPSEIFNISASRETALSRLLNLYLCAGLAFMLLPGTFLGVWNLITISIHRSTQTVSLAWIQAHGHAQIFGWIGTFILGIGFYSIPKLRRLDPFPISIPYTALVLWIGGVTAHWLCTVYNWNWRTLLPASSSLELAAFLIFFSTVSGHRPPGSRKQALEPWVFVVVAGTIGLFATLVLNLGISIWLALRGGSPEIPSTFDQKFLVLQTWGFLVPFVWGFSARWLPIFLGLQSPRSKALLTAVGMNIVSVVVMFLGWTRVAMFGFVLSSLIATFSLNLFIHREKPAKLQGVHPTFPLFVRLAYVWAAVSACMSVWAAVTPTSLGIWGASRHALTVGFLSTMVFAIGQRILPAFSGMKVLFSTRLMFAALLLLTLGCTLRVSSEILAYQDFVHSAWLWLPVSALTEMVAMTLFAGNLVLTFLSKRPSLSK